MRKKLDRLWFEQIYERDKGTCQRCKRGDTLAGHHIFGKRTYPATRWNLDNGILLCYACHIFFAHSRPEEFRRFLILWFEQRLRDTGSWIIKGYCYGPSTYDALFQLAQEHHGFRACDFESKKKELEEK